MRISTFIWSCLSTWAFAAPQSTSTAAQPAKTIVIEAGNLDFAFVPHTVFANVGDIIQWNFYARNHSVVRSAYEFPCVPINDTGNPEHLFASPIFTQTVTSNPPPSYSVRVNDTNPIWYYCSTIGSCNGQGMIGVINPGPGQTFSHQQSLALNAPFVLQPGQEPPPEVSGVSSPSSSSGGLSDGAIAGIVVGVILALALIGGLFYFAGRSKTYSDMLRGARHGKDLSASPPAAPAFNGQPSMVTYQAEDWKGPHSALTSPSYPPPYASPDLQFSKLGQAQGQYGVNMHGQYHNNMSRVTANGSLGVSRYSELGPSPSHEERQIHELETPLASPLPLMSPKQFSGAEDMRRG